LMLRKRTVKPRVDHESTNIKERETRNPGACAVEKREKIRGVGSTEKRAVNKAGAREKGHVSKGLAPSNKKCRVSVKEAGQSGRKTSSEV